VKYLYFGNSFLHRMTDTMTSQNVDLSSWDIVYSVVDGYVIITTLTHSMTYVKNVFDRQYLVFNL
jgi:hypothetical protein